MRKDDYSIIINNVCASYEGEGVDSGIPTIFVRVQGCSVHCSWCDTKHSHNIRFGKVYDIMELADKILLMIRDKKIYRISITGGNPAEQHYEVSALVKCIKCRYKGDIPLTFNLEHPGLMPCFRLYHGEFSEEEFNLFDTICFDFKTPSSGVYKGEKPGLQDAFNHVLQHMIDFKLNENITAKVSIKSVIANLFDAEVYHNAIVHAIHYMQYLGKTTDIQFLVSPVHNRWGFVNHNVYKSPFIQNDLFYKYFSHFLKISVQIHKVLGFE